MNHSTRPLHQLKRFTRPVRSLLRSVEGQEDAEVLSLLSEYSRQGVLLSERKMESESDGVELHSYTYDDRGNLIQHRLELPDDGICEIFVTARDVDGRPLSTIKYYGDDPGERTEYQYATGSHPVTIRRYDADGEEESTEKLQYDGQDRLLERVILPSGASGARYVFNYDQRGLLEAEEEWEVDGVLLSKTVFHYDEQGRDTLQVKTGPEGKVLSRMVFEYDDAGRLLKRTSQGYYIRVSAFEYDELGRITEETLSDENGFVITRTRLEYDEQGRIALETHYETDLTRSGRDTHFLHRYEYVFYE